MALTFVFIPEISSPSGTRGIRNGGCGKSSRKGRSRLGRGATEKETQVSRDVIVTFNHRGEEGVEIGTGSAEVVVWKESDRAKEGVLEENA